VVACARTAREGTLFEHSPTLRRSDTTPLPGSLATLDEAIHGLGGEVLTVSCDLLVTGDVDRVVAAAKERFGTVDVLVNAARYVGPGHADRFVDTPLDVIDAQIRCNVLAPLQLIQATVPLMSAAGRGVIVNFTSSAVWDESPLPPDAGGWGLGYSISKAALHRSTVSLAKELRGANIAVVNLDPGPVATERIRYERGADDPGLAGRSSVDVPASACTALATFAGILQLTGTTVEARALAANGYSVDALPAPVASD